MAGNIRQKFEEIQPLIPQMKEQFEAAEKHLKIAQEAKDELEIKTATEEVMDARRPLQLIAALQWIMLTDDPLYGKAEINDEHIEKNFVKHLAMLQGLESAKNNPGAEFIRSNYGKHVKKLLQDDKHHAFKTRVIWFALTLGDLYRGERSVRYLPGHWEDEVDLLESVKSFVNKST
jgi:hypothetical protein